MSSIDTPDTLPRSTDLLPLPAGAPATPHLDDDALYARFLDAALTAEQLGHRNHVRLAFLCVRRHPDLAEAAVGFRSTLRRLVAALGAEAKYNETLTWAYLVLVHQRAARSDAPDSDAFLAAHPELLDQRHGALARYYELSAVTGCAETKSLFLLPGDERLRHPAPHA